MAYESIKLEINDAVAILTFNRPEKRNAISHKMITEILQALDEVEACTVRVLIVTGAANSFCAGMDLQALKDFRAQSYEETVADSRQIATLFRRLYEFPKPTIAAVDGPAIAGGCGLATLCDFTLATNEAKFGYTEVRIGFIPALVSAYVIRQIGEKRARDLLLSGRIFSASEAQAMGIVNELLEPGQLMPRALELARQLAEMSPAALAHTKRLLVAFYKEELDRHAELGIASSARVRKTADFQEGLSAFLEKRKPQWRGK